MSGSSNRVGAKARAAWVAAPWITGRRTLRFVHLFREGVHVEPFAGRRGSQAPVETDEAGVAGLLAAPLERGGELQGIGGAQRMKVQEPHGALAQLGTRLVEPPFDSSTPATLNGRLLMRTILPIGSSVPNRLLATVVPRTQSVHLRTGT
jgi:hypothetical protein